MFMGRASISRRHVKETYLVLCVIFVSSSCIPFSFIVLLKLAPSRNQTDKIKKIFAVIKTWKNVKISSIKENLCLFCNKSESVTKGM